MVKRIHVPSIVQSISRVFSEAGYEVYLVGGAVRDRLLRRKEGKQDYDLATNAHPKDVQSLFRRVIPTGIDHGTVTVFYRGVSFEVTTFRSDGTYLDHRRPDDVQFSNSIHEDLKRRDFTMNALALHGVTGQLVDDHGGRDDIKGRVIRAIGDPIHRFEEDALRMLRACRFASQLGFTLEEATLEGITRCAGLIAFVSPERIKDELDGLLSSAIPSTGLELMRTTGLMEQILPELLAGVDVEQKGNHRFDVYRHCLLSCDGAPREHLLLRWAALLHDIGKPESMGSDELGITTFHRHEQISSAQAEKLMRRFCFSNRDREYILHLIRNHMYHYTPEWSDAAVRRFIAQVGYDALEDLFILRRADQYGTFGSHTKHDSNRELRQRIDTIRGQQDALTIKDLAVNGKDLMEELHLKPGRVIGVLLEQLLESVLDDPAMNNRAQLLEVAKRYYEMHLTGEQR